MLSTATVSTAIVSTATVSTAIVSTAMVRAKVGAIVKLSSIWRRTGRRQCSGATTSVAPACCSSAGRAATPHRACSARAATSASALTVLPAPTASASTPPRSGASRVALTWLGFG